MRNGTVFVLTGCLIYHPVPLATKSVHAKRTTSYKYFIEKKKETGRNKRQKKQKKQRTKDEKKKPLCSGRRPSPEGTKLAFAGTISPPTMCPLDAPTEGRHDEAKRKTRQEEGNDAEVKNTKQQCYYVQPVGQGGHKRPNGGQRRRAKNKT